MMRHRLHLLLVAFLRLPDRVITYHNPVYHITHTHTYIHRNRVFRQIKIAGSNLRKIFLLPPLCCCTATTMCASNPSPNALAFAAAAAGLPHPARATTSSVQSSSSVSAFTGCRRRLSRCDIIIKQQRRQAVADDNPSTTTTTTPAPRRRLSHHHQHQRRRHRNGSALVRASASNSGADSDPNNNNSNGNDRYSEFEFRPSPSSSMPPAPSAIDWQSWTSVSSSIRIPALPFTPEEVFLPGETKRLHLFEARYISLFEAVISQYDNHCGHILIDAPRRAMAAVGTLVVVRKWQRQAIGVSVEVDAVGRLHTTKLYPSNPYLTAEFSCVNDVRSADDPQELSELYDEFWKVCRELTEVAKSVDEPVFRVKTDGAKATIDAATKTTNDILKQHKKTKEQLGDNKNKNDEDDNDDSSVVEPTTNNDITEQQDIDKNGMWMSSTSSSSSNGSTNNNNNAATNTFEQVQVAIKTTAERAIAYKRIDWSPHVDDVDMLRRRAHAISFAAWDLFQSSAQQRQKALEQRSTSSRLTTAIEAMQTRRNQLAAKAALKAAFSS